MAGSLATAQREPALAFARCHLDPYGRIEGG